MKKIKFLNDNKDIGFVCPTDSDSLESLQKNISDKFYLDFIKTYNGGYFFDKALHIYGCTNKFTFHSINKINDKINHEYGKISYGNFFFASDVFGNQYCYDFQIGHIFLFNIESGDKEFVANNFLEWIEAIKSETDYYTGQSIIQKWEGIMLPVNYDERLTPKKPFVIGGDYHPNNLRVEKLDKILEFNSSIAKQIYDLPDGTSITIKLE